MSTIAFLGTGIEIYEKDDKKHPIYATSYPYLDLLYPLTFKKTIRKLKSIIWDQHTTIVSTVDRKKLKKILTEILEYTDKTANSVIKKTVFLKETAIFNSFTQAHGYFCAVLEIDKAQIRTTFNFKHSVGIHKADVTETYTYNYGEVTKLVEDLSELIYPLLRVNINERELANLILNLSIFTPYKTSSDIVKDLYRAIITSALLRLDQQLKHLFSIPKTGFLYLTGEIVSFIDDEPILLLSLIDGLGVKGTWFIFIDKNQTLRLDKAGEYVKNPNNLSIDGTLKYYLVVVPHTEKSQYIEFSNKKEHKVILVPHGSIFGFFPPIKNVTKVLITENNDINEELSMYLKEPHNLKALIIDGRKRPIEYGPTISENQKITLWLNQINNLTRI